MKKEKMIGFIKPMVNEYGHPFGDLLVLLQVPVSFVNVDGSPVSVWSEDDVQAWLKDQSGDVWDQRSVEDLRYADDIWKADKAFWDRAAEIAGVESAVLQAAHTFGGGVRVYADGRTEMALSSAGEQYIPVRSMISSGGTLEEIQTWLEGVRLLVKYGEQKLLRKFRDKLNKKELNPEFLGYLAFQAGVR